MPSLKFKKDPTLTLTELDRAYQAQEPNEIEMDGSLLLELRAQVASMSKLLTRACVQVERLDERVARMERRSLDAGGGEGSARGGEGRTASVRRVNVVRARELYLDDLSTELLAHVAAALPEDDELAAALTCRKMRASVSQRRLSDGRTRTSTSVGSAFSSLDKLDWSIACGLPLSPVCCKQAAERGQLQALSLLRERGCEWDEETCRFAALGGHFEVLRWAHAQKCPMAVSTVNSAAQGGHVGILQFLLANGCRWSETTCSLAAFNAHLAALQFLRSRGCPWNESTTLIAAGRGHMGVLQW